MDTIPLEMDEFFGENDDDDDIGATRLPDLDLEENLQPMVDSRYDESNEQAEDGEEPLTDNPELLAKLKSLKGASKNVQRRTFIKLDAARLTGERGIPILPKVFKNIKLKGKHHEAEDLKTIMHHLEHWGHRLFPKMPFTEVLERTERLGAKKPVQTCVKRIRLGMPILPSDFAEDEQDVHREGGDDDGSNGEDAPVTNSHPFSSQVPNDNEIDEFLSTAAELEREQTLEQSHGELQPLSSQTKTTTISEEAKARIERNKKLAMERRAARLAKGNKELTNNSVPPSPSRPSDLASQEIELDKGDDSEKQPSQQDDMYGMMCDKNDISRSDSVVDNDDGLRVDHNLLGDEEHELNSISTDNESKIECARSSQANDSQEDGRQRQSILSTNKLNDPEEINLGDVDI